MGEGEERKREEERRGYNITLLEDGKLSGKASLIRESIANNSLHISNGNLGIVGNIDLLHVPLEIYVHLDGWHLYVVS